MQSAHLIVIQTFLCKPKSSLHVSKQFFKYKRNLYTTNWLNFFEWTAMESIYFWSWEIVTFDWIFVCWWWSRTKFIYQKELLVNTRDRIIFHLLRFSIGIHLEILAVAADLCVMYWRNWEILTRFLIPMQSREQRDKWWRFLFLLKNDDIDCSTPKKRQMKNFDHRKFTTNKCYTINLGIAESSSPFLTFQLGRRK